MKIAKPDIEDLLSDESFINYCKGSSPEDILKWGSFLQENPDHSMLVDNVRARFIEIFNAICIADRDEQEAMLMARLMVTQEAPVIELQEGKERKGKNVFSVLLKLTAGVAVVLAAVFFIVNYNSGSKKEIQRTFVSALGERKNFQLPDGSVVALNAESKIYFKENFGISSRDIYLEGEAFFDAKHNQSLPFIVHTPAMDIKVMGTAFNVKAYPGEKTTETSLVRGIIEITLKEEKNRKVILHPNQKVQWETKQVDTNSSVAGILKEAKNVPLFDSLVQSLTKTDHGEIKETAWTENKLVFENEEFADIAILLERWYRVKLEFSDDYIRRYRFTGVFVKEQLGTVLSFLKESRSFNYEITSGDTTKVKIFI